jgi:putative endonuclease
MAGLVPAISTGETVTMRLYHVYILASRPGGALYVGVTNDLLRRVAQHKQGLVPGHTKRYKIDKLVYFEEYADVRDTIQREKNMKHWPRIYKTRVSSGSPIPRGAISLTS